MLPRDKPAWRGYAFVAVCASLLLMALVVHARTMRDASALRLAGAAVEPFAQPGYMAAQRRKTLAYARAGLRFFYSDGALGDASVPAHLYLLPTTHDIDCSLGDAARQARGCAPANSRIATLAAREARTAAGGAGTTATCAAAFPTASRLSQPGDSGLRVLEGRYDMTTACAVVRGRIVSTPNNPRVFRLVLTRPAAPETRALLLMRPTFVATATSRLYAVDPAGLDFDSAAARARPELRLLEVPATAPQVADTTAPRLTSSGGADSDLRLSLYYPSYTGPFSQPPRTQQLSLYLTLTPDLLARPAGATWATTGLVIALARPGQGQRTVSVRATGGRVDLPALPGAHIVVTRATNMLVVACMTPQRTILRVVGGLARFDLPRAEAAAVAAQLPVFKATPPLPYTPFCIPHLAHIADALGLLSD